MHRRAALPLVLALAVLARADGDGKDQPPAPAKPAPAPAAKDDDAAAAELPPVRGTQYRVVLTTGRSFAGVVTAPDVFERREGTLWKECDRAAPGAGIRVFFLHGQEGFVFVPLRLVKAAESLGAVTDDEAREIGRQRVAAARRAVEERDRIRRDREAREEAARAALEAAKAAVEEAGTKPALPQKPGPESPLTQPVSPEERIAQFTALLLKFPPGRWTPDTPKEIERRRIVMDLFPTDEEKQFLGVYDEWLKAYEVWKAGQPKAPEKAAAANAK